MHCLNLKITYDCTNHCSFCFSSYMNNTSMTLDKLKHAVIQGHESDCNELVLSGGEPTLYPHYVMELLHVAKDLNYKKFIIQTNGYGLAINSDFVSLLDHMAKTSDVCLSFSVHGHNAALHDDLCGTPGAFRNLMDAMDRISETNCAIYTNTVTNAKNLLHLEDIAALLKPYTPEIMQFAVMHLNEKNELSVPLVATVKAIRKLAGVVDTHVLKTEGIPYCLLHGMESCVGESAWPSVLDLYNRPDNYLQDFKQTDYGMRRKLTNCNQCIFDKICMGVWKEHFEEFSSLNIHPIR